MVMVLEQRMIDSIAECGRSASPKEACGILLPIPVNGVEVIEIPNRSETPEDSIEMMGDDVLIALEQVFRGDFPEDLIDGLTFWHTHPGGNIGPSRFDIQNKPPRVRGLVVTLFNDGRAPVGTWF